MTRLIQGFNSKPKNKAAALPKKEIRAKIDTVLEGLTERYNNSTDNNEKLAVINNMDDLVTSEIFYWSNVLNDLPEDCPPCMATKGNEAKNQIAALTPIVDRINKIRIELLAD